MLLLLFSAAMAQEAEVVATNRWGKLALSFVPPEGEYISDDGPFSLNAVVDEHLSYQLEGDGAQLSAPIVLRGAHIEGVASFPVCDVSGESCRIVDVGLRGEPGWGATTITNADVLKAHRVGEEPPPEAEPAPVTALQADDLDAALAIAAQKERLVLIHFGAVWCPPCHEYDEDIFSNEERVADLEPFVIVNVDVDTVESWPTKNRYAIGGYPTLLITDAEGNEIDRYVGFDGTDATLAWLARTQDGATLSVEDASPEQAAAQARHFAQQRNTERAQAWLDAAAGAEDSTDYRLARMHLTPGAEDAQWLLDAGVSPVQFMQPAMAIRNTEVRNLIRMRAMQSMANASAANLRDLSLIAAELAPTPEEREIFFGIRAAMIRAQMSGDPEQDRAHWEPYAASAQRAGVPEAAIQMMRDAVTAFPDEVTFHLALGWQLLEADENTEALTHARAAHKHGYGDNLLRATNLLAQALHANNKTDEALTLIDETLEAAPVPIEGVEVRTPRYLQALEQTRSDIAAQADTETENEPETSP